MAKWMKSGKRWYNLDSISHIYVEDHNPNLLNVHIHLVGEVADQGRTILLMKEDAVAFLKEFEKLV
jgi:hypothetical protein